MHRRLIAGKVVPLVVATLWVLLSAGTATACPGCKDALAANDNGGLVAGYFWSILFMMSMPFILVSTFGGSMYLSVRRARAAEAARAAQATQTEPAPADELAEV